MEIPQLLVELVEEEAVVVEQAIIILDSVENINLVSRTRANKLAANICRWLILRLLNTIYRIIPTTTLADQFPMLPVVT